VAPRCVSAATRLSSCRRLASAAPVGLFGVYSMNPFLWLIHTLIWIYIYLLIGIVLMFLDQLIIWLFLSAFS
jgi:hypothetical protein